MIMRFSKINILRLPQVENVLDLGYIGVKNDFPTVKSVLPFRKKRKSELSDEEKRHNRKHSKLRIIVEHTVSRIKKFGRYDHASDIANHWNDVTLENKQAKVKYHKEIFFRNYAIGLIPGSRIPDNIVLFN